MPALTELPGRALALANRAALWAARATQPNLQSGRLRWWWPSTGGDRGPPGSWQRNLNSHGSTMELIAFSAVYACIQAISSDIAKLPVMVNEVDLETNARKPRRRDYYAQLFREPNEYQTSADFMFGFVQSSLFQGNTYTYIGKRNGRGEPEEMHNLNPYRTTPLVNDAGDIFYQCAEDVLAGLPDNAIIPARDMIHHRLPLLPGYPLVGVTPIFAAAASSSTGIRILQNTQQFFGNMSRPSGTLNAPGKVGEPLAKRLAEEWDENFRGERMGKTAILSEGLEWKPLTITPVDAQLIETLRFSIEDVARAFRVPAYMLGDMSKVTYRNTEQLARLYVAHCIGWYLESIEKRFERAFGFPLDFEIRFDLSGLYRTEIDIRFAAYKTALDGGFKSINEVRSLEGDAPVEGGDEPRVQMQYVPLSQANEPPPPAAPAPAPAAEEEPDKSLDVAKVHAAMRRRRVTA